MQKTDIEIESSTRSKVQRFLERLQVEVKRGISNSKEDVSYKSYAGLFDFDSVTILSAIISVALKNESQNQGLNAKIAREHLSRLCGSMPNRKAVAVKLQKMARHFLISVDTTAKKWNPAGFYQKDTQTIFVSPALKIAVFSPNSHRRFVNDYIKKCAFLGRTRDDDEQGFSANYKYGNPETHEFIRTPIDFGDLFLKLTEKAADKQKKKEEDAKKWLRQRDDFIGMCARVWMDARAAEGHGTEMPDWMPINGKITPAGRPERNSLAGEFERHGGAFTALTWYLFCTLQKTYDAKGRVAYDPSHPHRQNKTPAMNPSKYAKEIHNITSDDAFKHFSQEGWPSAKKNLLKYFNEEILEVGPRGGNSNRHCFGQKPLPELPRKNV